MLQTSENSSSLSLRASLARDLIDSLDPASYLRRLGYDAYHWQVFVLEAIKRGWTRIHINGARQIGKTRITAGVPAFMSKSERALTLIYAPSDDQAKIDIEYVKEFIYRDESYPELVLDSIDHIKLPNGSFIKANTATAKTKRGRAMPRVIIFDEAAWTEDELYKTIRPMLTMNPRCILIAISTPHGRAGWFYRASRSARWLRLVVKAPWDIQDGVLVPASTEAVFQKLMAKQGIYGFYSPRHTDRDFMEEELEEHGERWFRQEYLCEYVEPEDAVFSYEDIERMMVGTAEPLKVGEIIEADIASLEVGR
jgi:hypothetical protein